jgi:diacylglycerol kinase family enzyme
MMNVALLFNPAAGSGRGASVAASLGARLREAGHAVQTQPAEPRPGDGWLADLLERSDVLVVAGGDGTVRLASAPALRAGKPLYPFPLGTENLLARELGITRSSRQLLDALEAFDVRRLDVGEVQGRLFVLMVSLGFDASVVADLAGRRRGGIRHLSYIGPLLRQLARWRAPELGLEIDDCAVVDRQSGFVVVANSRQYAARLDPAHLASMTDGALDVVFFPCTSRRALAAWAVACWLGRQQRDPRLVYRTGRRIVVRSRPEHAYQLDGDAPESGSPACEIEVRLQPGALPVLLPGRLNRP